MKQPGRTLRIAGIGLIAAGLSGIGSAAAQNRQRPTPPPKDRTRTFFMKSFGRGYLGVHVLGLTPELRTHFGASENTGVLVARVEEGSPAAAAGVQVGDVLTSVDGKPLTGPHSLMLAVHEKKAGDNVAIELLRDRGTVNVLVGVEERDRAVIDLAGIEALPEIAAFPPLPGQGMFLSPGTPLDEEAVQAFEEAMRDLEDRFESDEWQDRLRRFREIDLSKIQERMKEVEERLRKLESELDEEGQVRKKKLD